MVRDTITDVSEFAESKRGLLSSTVHGLMRYFFRPGGAYTLAICRIALFSYLYVHVIGDMDGIIGNGTQYLSGVNVAAYFPKSLVWMLFASAPPAAGFIDATLLLAKISTLMAIAGVLTRPAMILSTLSCVFLGALVFSWEPLWSHPYNSGLIAALGFMLGRAGDRLSVDSSVSRRVFGRATDIARNVYWWPMILGLFGVASVYFGGFYAKWSTPEFTYDLAWIFSDNLRNSMSLPWLIRGEALPAHVLLIVSNPFIWKFAAFGHLATQALPIFATFSLTRPYLRLFEGFVYAGGAVLLHYMMGMWNPEWLILSVFFVDWEYFLRKAGFKLEQGVERPIPDGSWTRGFTLAYALGFVALNLVIIFTRYDDFGNRLYPFSSMPFYSNVAALRPYKEHRHYPFTYGELILHYTDRTNMKWNCAPKDAANYVVTFDSARDPAAKVTQQLGSVKSTLAVIERLAGSPITDCDGKRKLASVDLEAIDYYSSILDIAPYPEPIGLKVGHRALVARYEKDRNRIIAAAGQITWENGGVHIDVASSGLDIERYEILLANDPWQNYNPDLIRLTGIWNGSAFEVASEVYSTLTKGWYPLVVRAHEKDGHTYDFFGGVLYK